MWRDLACTHSHHLLACVFIAFCVFDIHSHTLAQLHVFFMWEAAWEGSALLCRACAAVWVDRDTQATEMYYLCRGSCREWSAATVERQRLLSLPRCICRGWTTTTVKRQRCVSLAAVHLPRLKNRDSRATEIFVSAAVHLPRLNNRDSRARGSTSASNWSVFFTQNDTTLLGFHIYICW